VALTADLPKSERAQPRASTVVEARDVSRHFGRKVALEQVSLHLEEGQIHALLGPNGAGKTTLLRLLAGLVLPSSGSVRVLDFDTARSRRAMRQRLGLIPSGDRSFYLRISGFENLLFFARLHGMRKRQAASRSREVLEEVGLTEASHLRVGYYSHGMQKRLSIARALLTDPALFLVDEATHDLDPEGARQVRELIRGRASRGAGVIWATQRLDEIRGFADTVTLISQGKVCFSGTVPRLMSYAIPRRYLLRVRNGRLNGPALAPVLDRAVAGLGTITSTHDDEPDSEHFLLSLADDAVLGDAIASLVAADVQVLACSEERSEIEEAFLSLTQRPSA
jgi:ABC-2 type transport system ATP-binding protein